MIPTLFNLVVYLAAILDAYSRKCVGWKLSKQIDTQLTLAALDDAIAHRHHDVLFNQNVHSFPPFSF